MAKVTPHVYPLLQNLYFDPVNHMWHATYVFILFFIFLLIRKKIKKIKNKIKKGGHMSEETTT